MVISTDSAGYTVVSICLNVTKVVIFLIHYHVSNSILTNSNTYILIIYPLDLTYISMPKYISNIRPAY